MLNLADYTYALLEKIFKSDHFQVWLLSSYLNEMALIYGEQHPAITAPQPEAGQSHPATYQVTENGDRVEIVCHYPQGSHIVIYLLPDATLPSVEEIEVIYYLLYAIELEKINEARNKELQVVTESIGEVTASLNLEMVLEQIIKNALKVVPDADAGHLMLYDADTEMLVLKAHVGFFDSIYQFKTQVGESITGKVFEDGQPRIYNTQQDALTGMRDNNVTDKNYDNILQSITRAYEGVISVPVEIGEARIGALTIHKYKNTQKITKQNLYLLQGFASQTAIAIQNANLHKETEDKLQKITQLSNALQEKNAELQQRYEIHEKLTAISLENKGVNFLIDTLSQMIKEPIIFYNSLENTLYSPDQTADIPISPIDIKQVCASSRQPENKTMVSAAGIHQLFPIYNQSTFLGCLMILASDALSRSEQITLEQSNSILALELVRDQTKTNIYYQGIYDKVQELLTIKDTDALSKKAAELGLRSSAYWAIGILEIPKEAYDYQYLDIKIYNLIAKINTEVPQAAKIAYGQHNRILILMSLQQPDDIQHIHEKLNSLRKKSESDDGIPFRGGLSNVYKRLEMISKCFEEASKTLDYLANRHIINVIRHEEMGLNRLFTNQNTHEIDQFINEFFAPFSSGSGKYKELEKTLITYMALNRAVNATAEQLHIHINTLYQRLRKIEDLLGIDLNDSQDSLNVHLACHLKNTQTRLSQI